MDTLQPERKLDNSYHLRTEIFVEPIDEGYLVYAPTRKVAFLADEHLANAFQRLSAGVFRRSDDPDGLMAGLIDTLRLNQSDEAKDGGHIEVFDGDPLPTSVTLFLTTSCNLRCTYCCVSAGDRIKKAMSIETARHAIDYIVKNAETGNKTAVYVGFVAAGEPTVNWDVLTQAFEHASSLAQDSGLGLTTSLKTNGVMSSEKAAWVAQKIDQIQVSFDGLPNALGSDRPTVAGKDSTPLIERTLRYFDKVGKSYKVRVTVPQSRIEGLATSIDYICREFSPDYIQIEPAYQMGRYESQANAETLEFLQALRSSIEIGKKRNIRIVFGGAEISVLKNHFCGISMDEFSISSDGNVTSCSTASTEDDPLAEHFFYGERSESGYEFSIGVLERLRGRSVENREHCQSCFAKWHCGGECHYKILARSEVENFAGTERCRVVREIVKDRLVDEIRKTKGTIWLGS